MIRVHGTIAEWHSRRREIDGRQIGFVPTMGALHAGHASLVERCRREMDVAAVSIFVNPTQFNDPSDLERYPRTLATDLALLESLGVDDVVVPTAAEMYAAGYSYRVENSVAPVLEAVYRPGFFTGVLTVVLKLLNLVSPTRAYFGEKDYQQLQVVTEMAREFFLPVEIVGCPTMREPSGLAMSSRNVLLSPEGRTKAAAIHRALTTAPNSAGARNSLEAAGFVVEYVEERWGRRLAAAFLEGVRLIDNVPVH